MSEQEKIDLREKICKGLKQSFENLLRRKAALGQDMVFADENGQPRIVPAREALAEYERRNN
ncbi:MAG: hypothetical protein SO542_06555 [Muribaculaceae bacterium]|nr:hypothetical protein [Muribaculaceae bacterium]MCI6495269.1 hypothetical protein [Bacteroidales bacterium]MDY4650227.1 hypothetical protein [Muribaculaceae bacterium]MDY5387888.1 hypothetical protein [Muribaculaceae bacterium]